MQNLTCKFTYYASIITDNTTEQKRSRFKGTKQRRHTRILAYILTQWLKLTLYGKNALEIPFENTTDL